MDSMRHLSTSLPRQRNDSDLLSDFKAAALSVTNLYKTAATSQTRARAAGYQDALDELLAFLDGENMGLMDGEGWRVRQWATERLDGDGTTVKPGNTGTNTMTDDEDDNGVAKDDNKEEGTRSSSPDAQKKSTQLPSSYTESADDENPLPRRVVSEPPQPQPQPQQQTINLAPPQGIFTFQSTRAWPSNHDREGNMDLDAATTPPPQNLNGSSAPSSTETVRILSRSARSNRHTNHNRRTDNRASTISLNLGPAAGGKRKIPYPDFFDISEFNDGMDRKDGNGTGRGGKRGRHA